METNVVINDIYQNVLGKFYDAMQKINIESAEDNINYIMSQLNAIIGLLKECQSGAISIDSIKLLNDVSFNDFLTDKHIIEAVSSNHTVINDSNIFIRKTSQHLEDWRSFFRIIEKDGHYIAIKYWEDNILPSRDNITEEIISSLNELNSFVSLDKVLNDCEYIGYSAETMLGSVTILYSGQIYVSDNYFTLYRRHNRLELHVTDRPYSARESFLKIYYEKYNIYIESDSDERCLNDIDGSADRMFVLKVIGEQLDKQYSIPEEGKSAVKTLA